MKAEKPLRQISIVSIRQVKESTIEYENVSLTSPAEVYNLAKTFIEGYDREVMLIITLNTRKKPNSISIISIGTINASLVHPREVFKTAITSNASSIIMVHNHPSGECSPSKEDNSLTERIRQSGKLLGIELVDHMVVGDNTYYSYRESGKLK